MRLREITVGESYAVRLPKVPPPDLQHSGRGLLGLPDPAGRALWDFYIRVGPGELCDQHRTKLGREHGPTEAKALAVGVPYRNRLDGVLVEVTACELDRETRADFHHYPTRFTVSARSVLRLWSEQPIWELRESIELEERLARHREESQRRQEAEASRELQQMAAGYRLPAEVVDRDRELEAAALAAIAALDEHRWRWTKDDGTGGQVTIGTYAETVDRDDGAVFDSVFRVRDANRETLLKARPRPKRKEPADN
jgi:hypothetical protein